MSRRTTREGTINRRCVVCALSAQQSWCKTCRGHGSKLARGRYQCDPNPEHALSWACPTDPSHTLTWAAVVDVAPPGASRRRQARQTGFGTKAEASAWLEDQLRQVQESSYVEPTKLTFGRYIEEMWLPSQEALVALGELKPTTFDSYRQIACYYLIPHLGHHRLQELRSTDLSRTYGFLANKGGKKGTGLSRRTVRYAHVVARKALDDAKRSRLLRDNPAVEAKAPKAQTRRVTKEQYWSSGQVRAFFGHMAEDRLFPVYWFILHTGCRRAEAAGLRWENLDLDRGKVLFSETRVSVNYQVVESTPKTEGSARTISLDPETVRVLREWRKTQLEERLAWGEAWTDTGHVFTRECGLPYHPERLYKMFQRAVAGTDLPRISLHGLRHSSASALYEAGVPEKVIQERLGHSSSRVTSDIYLHLADRLDGEAAEKLSRVFGAAQ